MTDTTTVWKCFRCELLFKKEQHAKIHQEISKHSVSRVKAVIIA